MLLYKGETEAAGIAFFISMKRKKIRQHAQLFQAPVSKVWKRGMGFVLLNRRRERVYKRAILDIVGSVDPLSSLELPLEPDTSPPAPHSETRESPFGPGWFA